MVQGLAGYVRRMKRLPKGRALGAFLFVGAALAVFRPPPPPETIGGLAGMLAAVASGVVLPADVRWEASQGELADLVMGRWVDFLAGDTSGAPRDLWRARVRVTPEGAPLTVSDAHNLTATPLGDDHDLVVRDGHAAFATYAYGQEQSVTLLELEGDPGAPGDASLPDRAMRWGTGIQETGQSAGIGRIDVTLDPPATRIGLALGPKQLDIDLADNGGGIRHATLDYATRDLVDVSSRLHAEATRHLPKRFILWAVDTVRAVPWIGPTPIAWLEEKVFAAKDLAKRLSFEIDGGSPATLARPEDAAAASAPPPPIGTGALRDESPWPPPPVVSIWRTPAAGEGQWKEPQISWLRKPTPADAGRPPAILRSFVRPDEQRPYAEVLLVAFDMRQLDLDMEAGTEDPKPLTGGHGPGRIPRDPSVLTRVVAAFNGAFKTEHGNYGMMVHKRILLPPQPNAATVVVLADGRTAFGTWGATPEMAGLRGISEKDIASFRQNLDPLLDQGKINPMGRALWGYTLPGSGMQTQRSGVCVTSAGNILYAWGDDVSASALAKAMQMAGCSYGMHLDMNPHHTGFIFAAIDEIKGHRYRSELLTPLMDVSPDRYIEYAPKDFFYLTLHDPSPSEAGVAKWVPDPGTQPAPSWLPAVWSGQHLGQGEALTLTDVEPGRVSWRLRAGMKEPDAKTGATPSYDLAPEDARRVVLAISVGLSPEKHPRGLATNGRMVFPLRALSEPSADGARYGVLVAQADGALAILRAAELATVTPRVDLAEVPLLLDGGAMLDGSPREGQPGDRAALGMTADGRVIVAAGPASSYGPLAEALKEAGCVRAIALDRGQRTPPFLHRPGTAAPVQARYEETVLYALGEPMKPRAFRFESDPTLAEASKK